MERVRRRYGFINGIDVDPDGSKGGLCLAWKEEVSIMLQSFSKRHIDVLVDNQNDEHQWRFTGFYGSPYAQYREESWNLLKSLRCNKEQPWIVCEDFNEIMYEFEKKGGLPREERRMEAFHNTLEDYQLIDVGYSENWFTWERGNFLETNIRERLDRGLTNMNWMSMFPKANIQHLVHSTSDHCPLLITTNKEENRSKWETFKFEAWLVMEETFEVEVKLMWETASDDLLQKLEYRKIGLKKWATRIRLSRKRKKELLTSKLSDLMEAERADNNLAELIDAKLQLNFEIDKDESYWKQKARVNWLKLGDRNTTFFHSVATQKRRKNCIQMLQDTDGRETGELQDMAEITRTYFQELFKAKENGYYEHILIGVEHCISEEDNRRLTMPYIKEEIWEALTSMGATKALGEDGFPAIFFQKLWHIIGDEVSTYCLQQLNGGMEVSRINTTHIVLIPKKNKPNQPFSFSSISLYNVIYKIMAKAIANHFRGVLEKCIDKAQSAFVPRRLISDNVFIAYEILHTLKRKK
ncbi:reverse transcriptase [Gossypium australe]|uniref:Reverse transcriptase n=1 Tax=Gossypium australe TaxID=47621 RepID=A0A5B6WQN8_9ROSI|nr:reverse transcriptase [Gossypium australe]